MILNMYLVKSPGHGNNKASSEIISNHFATCVQKCRDVCHISVLRLFCSILIIIGWLLKANPFQSMFVKYLHQNLFECNNCAHF